MRIRIISGVYGRRVDGCVKATTPADGPFEATDAEGARLLALGVAAPAGGKTPGAGEKPEPDTSPAPKKKKATSTRKAAAPK